MIAARAVERSGHAAARSGRAREHATAAVPPLAEAEALAREILGPLGTRFDHVRTAAGVATSLAVLFDPEEHSLLVVAAQLHDIGYSATLADSGFHPLDGAMHLRRLRCDERLVSLVAHHSAAELLVSDRDVAEALEGISKPRESMADALTYADMHSSPAGQMIPAVGRIADIERRHVHPGATQRTRALRASVARIDEALREARRSGGH